jgi:hypothetical protein
MFEVVDQLEMSDKTPWQIQEDLAALEELWLEKLQPYEERGYHARPLKS